MTDDIVKRLRERSDSWLSGGPPLSAATMLEAADEIERLRGLLAAKNFEHTHECIACFHSYTPAPDASEDCPRCGCDGTAAISQESR